MFRRTFRVKLGSDMQIRQKYSARWTGLSSPNPIPGWKRTQPDVSVHRPQLGELPPNAPAFNTKFAHPEGLTVYENDWSEEPEYPEIDPETHTWSPFRRQRLQNTLDWHAKVKNASCPEAKNLEINMPRQFGYPVYEIKENHFDYDCINAYKYITRTHIVSDTQLPSQYSSQELVDKVEHFKQKVKEPLLDTLRFELDLRREFVNNFNELPNTIDEKKSQSIVTQINRIILAVLGPEVDHLQDCQVDTMGKVEAFWHVGGMQPTVLHRAQRKGAKNMPKRCYNRAKYVEPDDPVERNMYYIGSQLTQVRCKDPICNFVHPSDPLCTKSIEEFPDRFPHFVEAYGFRKPADQDYRFASIIPGHWSGDSYRCNLLAYHGRSHLLVPERVASPIWSAKDESEAALFSQAMLVSFGRLVGQALYHGFDQYGDLEYPFSTQTIISNGLDWSFFAYQMNTFKLHQLALAKNQKQNLIWGTETQSIFSKEKPNELNDQVVENILKFYLNQPKPIEEVNPTPYLSTRIQDENQWKIEKERIEIFYNFRYQISQRVYLFDTNLKFRRPEMYEYEKIYKHLFKAMPMEPRRKWFELPSGVPGSRPWLDPYKMRDPLRLSKGPRNQIAKAMEKREEARIEAEKVAENLKYGIVTKPKPKKK